MHPRLAAFLDDESRQVWALRRDDGTAVYLPDGMADEMRALAREHLRCPYPGCVCPISTRGGTKRRHHFFHRTTVSHPTEPESEAHLAAKAMLVDWARSRVPAGADVEEEQSLKDDDGRLIRRPDVLVTGASGRRVAFEVEYKNWSVEGWKAKQRDLDQAGVACLWLLGHTRVSLSRDGLGRSGETPVRVPGLASAIGRANTPLLVVNPVTRQVGTLSSSGSFTRRWRGEFWAYLRVDDLDDCAFDPRLGIRTPTLDQILAAEAIESQKEAATRQRQAEARQHLEDAWQASAVRADLLARHGAVPSFLEGPDTSVIRAAGVHWRAALWVDLVEGRTAVFAWPEVEATLRRHGLGWARDRRFLYGTVEQYMGVLARLGALRWYRKGYRSHFSPTGATVGQVIDGQAGEHRAAVIAREQQEKAEREAAAREAAYASDLEARRRTRLVIDEGGTRRWVPK
ncbi:hypothetical protein EXE59_09840 [Nocardioides eburneiflavus]|uniref:Competence protein CoiA nuclease-like domain-containing protein n=1 Tax=Nocardioides eburneiflavus TaxID=2518372 RepID=A0A4Z1CK55_9ACTN|nr:competence protein CoiA family protein [Nocardioides eburneiflavus]TGN64220.1 hypothetical protein EXE59_09840 [Nocardioides eburneiflavus]